MNKKFSVGFAFYEIILYLCFSFVTLHLDFRLWSEPARLIYIFLSVFILPLSFLTIIRYLNSDI